MLVCIDPLWFKQHRFMLCFNLQEQGHNQLGEAAIPPHQKRKGEEEGEGEEKKKGKWEERKGKKRNRKRKEIKGRKCT